MFHYLWKGYLCALFKLYYKAVLQGAATALKRERLIKEEPSIFLLNDAFVRDVLSGLSVALFRAFEKVPLLLLLAPSFSHIMSLEGWHRLKPPRFLSRDYFGEISIVCHRGE